MIWRDRIAAVKIFVEGATPGVSDFGAVADMGS